MKTLAGISTRGLPNTTPQFGQPEPLTFDALLPPPPPAALLSSVKPPAGDAKPEPENPPAPVVASHPPRRLRCPSKRGNAEIPDNQPQQEASAAAAAKTKKPRAQRSRY